MQARGEDDEVVADARVAVCCDSTQPDAIARAEEIAYRLGLARVQCDSHEFPLLLAVTDERLELRETDRRSGPVASEFALGRFGYRRRLPLRRELIVRAVGFKGEPLDVLDMTAGLGRDAMVLALAGCRVTAVESHPIVFELLADGVRRACRDSELAVVLDERLRLVQRDAVEYLRESQGLAPPDVVYLDPMFPPRTDAALAKKEMVALARLTGGEDDAEHLLVAALTSGCRRVVLKRPRRSPRVVPAGGPAPSVRFEGRAARFDVYFPRAGSDAG